MKLITFCKIIITLNNRKEKYNRQQNEKKKKMKDRELPPKRGWVNENLKVLHNDDH